MDDNKFILMDLHDEKTSGIAEILKSKTAKKILDYLSEVKEASEKDIADNLELPINTVEYNLRKLVDSGLVKKTANFFWSVKGKKIPMYKLARKHIVISSLRKPELKVLKMILPVILIAFIVIVLTGLLISPKQKIKDLENRQLKQFSSYDELQQFLNMSSIGYGRDYSEGISVASTGAKAAVESETAKSYSKTNIQVEGVDEADIVKNDGKYIYILSGNKVIIVNAYPAEDMKILSEINFSNPVNLFLNEDKLIVFEESYEYNVRCLGYRCSGSESKTKVYIYNIEERENPKLEANLSFDGNYFQSRMIGNYVYLISTKYANIAHILEYSVNGVAKIVPINDIYYFDYYDNNYIFTSISAINIDNGEINSKVYLTGGTGTIYVSENNIYLTYQKRLSWREYSEKQIKEVYLEIAEGELKEKIKEIADSNPYGKLEQISELVREYSNSLKGDEKSDFDKKLSDKLEEFGKKIAEESEKTIVHKININELKIDYRGIGEVPGHVLNQFSMDEYSGNFRIATTVGEIWEGKSVNNIYVLDEELKIIGKLEDLGKGEKIYSARFIGKRAYLVTFKKVDPFFVIDLTNPEKPEILGYLKIPGYSDYLHPYDENHVIGIGKEAVDANEVEKAGRELDFAWYQGVKIALFDVSDVKAPKQNAKFIIGDRGTDSPVLYDHKAFLFDKEKNLLVIPVSVAEIDKNKYADESKILPTEYGEIVWQGAYILNINENEISLRGRVTHSEYDKQDGSMDYKQYLDYQAQIQRSLYIDNMLYTISQIKIKANLLTDLSEIKELLFRENNDETKINPGDK